MTKETFDSWKDKVDAILAGKLGGLISDDLPDCPYYDWYQSQVMAGEAALRAIDAADDFLDEEDEMLFDEL